MSSVHLGYDSVVLTQTLNIGETVSSINQIVKHKSNEIDNCNNWEEHQEEQQEEELLLIKTYSNVCTGHKAKMQKTMQFHSPFHFASTAQFHNQLRRTVMAANNDCEENNDVQLHTTYLTTVDGMCHEWPELKNVKTCKKANRLQGIKSSKTNEEKETIKECENKVEATKKANERENNNSIIIAPLPSHELSLLHRVAINESVLSELIDGDSEVTTLIAPEIHDTSESILEHNTNYNNNENQSSKTFSENKDVISTSTRKVPSIREYVEKLRSPLNNVHVNTNVKRTLLKRKRVTSARTSSNNESSINNSNLHLTKMQEKEMQVEWQLLVDFREKINGSHEQMVKLLERHCKCKIMSASLPIGDIMINVDMASNNKNAHEFISTLAQKENEDRHKETLERSSENVKQDVTSVPSSSLFSHLLPVVIERKTVEDVAASIKDGRYYEQRHLLQHGPFALVIWLIEGEISNNTNNNHHPRDCFYKKIRTKCKQFPAKETNAQTQTRTKTNKCKEVEELLEETSTVSQIDEVWEVLSDAPDTVLDEKSNKNNNNNKSNDKDEEEDMCFRRLRSVIASLSSFTNRTRPNATFTPNTMVVRTKHIQETATFLSELAHHLICKTRTMIDICETTCNSNDSSSSSSKNYNKGKHELFHNLTQYDATAKSKEGLQNSQIKSVNLCFNKLLNTSETFCVINEQQRVFHARTAPVRMLMCIRGCSSTLACLLLTHYGTILDLWRRLTKCTAKDNSYIDNTIPANLSTCHVDYDEVIQSLPVSQKKVFVLLTEFLLAREYMEAHKETKH